MNPTWRWSMMMVLTLIFGVWRFAAAAPQTAVRLIAADTTFFCARDEARPNVVAGGLVCDILREMALRVGYSGSMDLYPLQRALMIAATEPGVLVAPVGRIPSRENSYQWLVPLLEDDFVVVSRRDSNVDISSLTAIGRLNMGVVRDGAAAAMALEQGWKGVQLATGDVTNALKLERGRIDAWIGAWNAILTSQRAAGLPVNKLRRGLVLRRVRIYLAGSRDLDPAVGMAWQAAFDTMVKDGSYQRLLRSHGYEAPSPALR